MNLGGWDLIEFFNDFNTVVLKQLLPKNDLKEHALDCSCWCNPILEELETHDLLIHNSMDTRELYESGERILS